MYAIFNVSQRCLPISQMEHQEFGLKNIDAGVMELADVVDSKSTGGDTVPVRVRPPAPKKRVEYSTRFYLCLSNIVYS